MLVDLQYNCLKKNSKINYSEALQKYISALDPTISFAGTDFFICFSWL